MRIRKNIVIAGIPHLGKSTLLGKVLDFQRETFGLITKEITAAEGGERIGFQMGEYPMEKAPSIFARTIAHVHFPDEPRVSKYGIKLEWLNDLAKKGLAQMGSITPETLLYLDEIGQMQLFSEKFKQLVQSFLDSPNTCVATLSAIYSDDFINAIKNREDVITVNLTAENRNDCLPVVESLIEKVQKAKKYILEPKRFFKENDLVEVSSDHGKRIVNLTGKTCTCDFYHNHLDIGFCSHIIAAEYLYAV